MTWKGNKIKAQSRIRIDRKGEPAGSAERDSSTASALVDAPAAPVGGRIVNGDRAVCDRTGRLLNSFFYVNFANTLNVSLSLFRIPIVIGSGTVRAYPARISAGVVKAVGESGRTPVRDAAGESVRRSRPRRRLRFRIPRDSRIRNGESGVSAGGWRVAGYLGAALIVMPGDYGAIWAGRRRRARARGLRGRRLATHG
ncbi:hypothetical protein EVAR_102781_1 [Eumeta japonica]|uniref:Uncharacterized protein n=1 Tax=Eumeta variegata TaxID=151549 RepID=A0A4C1TKI1_EUMVA|nr:hypothetical protein EVAR_102781_1 [Eumeta japonica]